MGTIAGMDRFPFHREGPGPDGPAPPRDDPQSRTT